MPDIYATIEQEDGQKRLFFCYNIIRDREPTMSKITFDFQRPNREMKEKKATMERAYEIYEV